MCKSKALDRLISSNDINYQKNGFPDIGKRGDNKAFSLAVNRIAINWKFYDEELYNVKSKFNKVINLGSGNPEMSLPFPLIKKNIKKCLKLKTLFKYEPAAGNEYSRKQVADFLNNKGFKNLSFNNLIVTTSTTQAFSFIIDTIARPYDVILMTAPNYGLFSFMPERSNVNVEMLELSEKDCWYINPKKLDNKIKQINKRLTSKYKELDYVPRVVAFFNMNPHNPTGKVMGVKEKKLLYEIGRICNENGVFIIDDLIYQDLSYDKDNIALPIGSFQEFFDNTITMYGLSKSYGVASIRAGCIVANEKVIKLIRSKLFHHMDSAPILQSYALMGAYNNTFKRKYLYNWYFSKRRKNYINKLQLVETLIDGIDNKHNVSRKIKRIIKKNLELKSDFDYIKNGIPYVSILNNCIPESGFFLLLDFTKLKKYSKIQSEQLLLEYIYRECGVKFLMGQSIAFPDKEKLIGRFTYSLSEKELVIAFERINRAVRLLLKERGKKMKQIEVTTKVNDSLENAIKKLEDQGFKKIRESRIEDAYLTQRVKDLKHDNIVDILSSCVLLRYLNVNNEQTFKKITYKNKVYEGDTVISEEKINLNCEDLEKAEKLFNALGFEKLVDVKYDVIVLAKGKLEFAFQNVENLGLLLEYENLNDFDNISNDEILKEKEKMIGEIRSYNLNVTDDYDVKKAYELIEKLV